MSKTRTHEVLDLEEVATYLRLAVDVIADQAEHGQIPGRKISDAWRFLKTAIDDWLRSVDDRALPLRQSGALADDDTLAALRRNIYQSRKRSDVVRR